MRRALLGLCALALLVSGAGVWVWFLTLVPLFVWVIVFFAAGSLIVLLT